jgi:phosphatidylserine decarboxylase
MPIYVRIGMQLLYHGKEQVSNYVLFVKINTRADHERARLSLQEKLLSGARLEGFLKAQTEKQGKAFDSPNQALEHIQAFVKTYSSSSSPFLGFLRDSPS